MSKTINIDEAFSRFGDHWSPRIAARINDFEVKIVKLEGEFVWHHHDEEDELFLVVKGRLTMRFRDGEQTVGPGEMIVVPHGVEHCPAAAEETHVVLFERTGTPNTGSAGGERTKAPVALDEARG
jgi:mannose-6-phosphate isomerase-like protein (cupin superfamily)